MNSQQRLFYNLFQIGKMDKKLEEFKKIAKENNIPIIRDISLKYMIGLFKENNIKNILEIGSAVGYSAIMLDNAGFNVVSIEKDLNLFKIANENKIKYNATNTTFINADARFYKINKIFDAIFIDGAKSKYLDFFINFEKNLKIDGIILFDNMNFAMKDIDTFSKRLKPISKKMHQFLDYINKLDNYTKNFLEVDDGLLVIKKIK